MKMKKILKTSVLASSAFVALSGSSFAAGTLSNGLVNYWNLDNNLTDQAHGVAGTASTVQDDGSFAGANGTGGIAFGTGVFGGGITQDGAAGGAAGQENNGFVNIPRSGDTLFGDAGANPANVLTTSIWVQVGTFDTGWQSAISHGEGQQYRIARRGAGNGVGYAGGVGEGGDDVVHDITAGWHHLVSLSDGLNGTKLWVDGVLVSTNVNAADINDDQGLPGITLDLNIGANPNTGANNREWNGEIDDVAQWNRVLTDTEISDLYGGGPTTATSLGDLMAIPEPSSGLLGLLGLSFFFRRRR